MLNHLFAVAAIAVPFTAFAAPFAAPPALAMPLDAIAQSAQSIPIQTTPELPSLINNVEPTGRSSSSFPTVIQTDLSGTDNPQIDNPQIEVYRRPSSLGRSNTRRSDFNNRFGTTRSRTRQLRTPANQLFSTFCTYSPISGKPNPLGQRAFITVTEVAGTSIFRYEQFSAIASAPQSFDLRQYEPRSYPSVADVAATRSITFYDTPLQLARQQLANSPTQYAELLGLSSSDPVVIQGYGSVDRLLACQEVGSSSIASISEATSRRFGTPSGAAFSVREIETPSRSLSFSLRTAEPPVSRIVKTISDLPDGNYRYTSSTSPSVGGGFINGELQQSGDRLFAFRKSGGLVVGTFAYLDSGESACVSGVIQGNTVVGEASVDSASTSFGTNVLGRTYLGPGLSLQLGENRDAVLSLSGFSRINAGEVVPPTSCG